MDIVVTGRHTQITDRFRMHLEEKLSKVPQLLPRVSRIDVVVTHEKAVRNCDAVEITCHARGPVIRAEACTDDLYAALDMALDKLFERLRRASDRRRVSRTGRRVPESVARATGRLTEGTVEETVGGAQQSEPAATPAADGAFGAVGDSPIEVREKVHASAPMTLEDALNQMELVGHDFYLFHDSDTGQPSVVYRRRGWSYGVIHLKVDAAEEPKQQPGSLAAAGRQEGPSVGSATG
ncbi:MAG: ribosome-associated translation inhibitor RaiA [Lapillicoccus sp.]